MPYDWRTETPGVFSRHADDCPVRNGHPCTCGPLGYRASARDPGTGRRVLSPDYQTVADARAWLDDQHETAQAARGVAREEGELGAVIDDFIIAAENGLARDGGGVEYSPQRVRELRDSLAYVDEQLGTMKIQDVRRRNVQAMVDQLRAAGLDANRLGAVVEALRSLYTYAIQREAVDFSPVVQLTLPAIPQSSPSQAQTQPVPAATQPTQPAATFPALSITQPVLATATATSPNGAQPGQQPSQQMSAVAEKYYEALTPERVLWWTVLIIVIVSVLIAIVLAAESV